MTARPKRLGSGLSASPGLLVWHCLPDLSLLALTLSLNPRHLKDYLYF